jgi:hypothetical protein
VDQATIQNIAETLASQLSSHLPRVLIVQGVIAILCAAIGAFAGEYLRTRGKNFATKADFEMLQHQLEKQTKLVETVRTEVSQKDWMKREWLNLRRIKLEALVEKLNDVDEFWRKAESLHFTVRVTTVAI